MSDSIPKVILPFVIDRYKVSLKDYETSNKDESCFYCPACMTGTLIFKHSEGDFYCIAPDCDLTGKTKDLDKLLKKTKAK